jgi:p-hydroxybenzoate 3-monooxygenase
VWRTQRFAAWMTHLFHRLPDQDDYLAQLQISELEYVCSSKAAATTLAENYVGFERV